MGLPDADGTVVRRRHDETAVRREACAIVFLFSTNALEILFELSVVRA